MDLPKTITIAGFVLPTTFRLESLPSLPCSCTVRVPAGWFARGYGRNGAQALKNCRAKAEEIMGEDNR